MHPAMVKRHGAIAAVSPLLAPAVPHDEVSAAFAGDVFISDNRHRMPARSVGSSWSIRSGLLAGFEVLNRADFCETFFLAGVSCQTARRLL